MTTSTLLILPSLDGGEAIVAKSSAKVYDTTRVPVEAIPALELSDPVIILPGQLVRIFETNLPKAGRAQQLQMARFAREDDIASAADTLHFALSDTQPPHLAVVDQHVMDHLRERFGEFRSKAVYADYDLLDGDDAILVIDRIAEPGVSAVDLGWTDETSVQVGDAELAALFAKGIDAGRGVNLMQGNYRAKSNIDLPKVPMIRFGALAATALVAFSIWNGIQDRAALSQAEDLRAATAADYTALMGERAPSRPGRAAARALQSGPVAPTGFLDLSALLFSGLSEFDDMRVDQMRYNAEEGVLRLRLIYPNFDAASRVETAITNAGGVLTTGGVREQGGVFVGEATLSLGGAS